MAQLKSTVVQGNLTVTGKIIGDVQSSGGTSMGSVTSVGLSVPTGLTVTGSPITSSGVLAVSLTSGYSIPLAADVTKGVTAHGWGNHADQGYLTSGSLSGYATQTWVQSQGYLTSGSLNGYATQTWVQSQGYITVDTKNTAGATNNTGGPLYLIGAATQDANPQTYSNSGVSMKNGVLTATSFNINSKATWQYNSSTDCIELAW